MIAALFVDPAGIYSGLPWVDCWGENRDARNYAGPWPVVAHPPCARWCRLAGLVEKKHGYMRGDDGGCFESALSSVRTHGGVLEHPAYSAAWAHFGIARPNATGGWQRTLCGGWTCHVEQWFYGHKAKKATWLYAYGVDPLPMKWGFTPDAECTAYVTDGGGDLKRKRAAGYSWCGNTIKGGQRRDRLGAREASATPIEFRDALLLIARTSYNAQLVAVSAKEKQA